jgi:hypothetical protein
MDQVVQVVEINVWAVILATLSSMVIGMIWYAIVGAIVLAVLTAYILAHVTYISSYFFQVSFMESALNTAFWLWLGIAMPTIVTHGLFEKRRKKLMAMTSVHTLITFLAMGLIIGALKP